LEINMPLLTYSYPDFTTQTVISSTQVNAKYNDIKTLLNTTGLDDTNLQNAGITRASKLKAGTANYVVINGSDGKMSEEAQLSVTRGGTGLNLALSSGDAGKVIQVNAGGTALELAAAPESPGTKLYIFNRLV
jgi:hypothetical protein